MYALSSYLLLLKYMLRILDRKQTQRKHKTSRFTWFPKTGYVHGGSRLYINGGMIQTLNSTQYNPTKPSVSLLHLFLSNLHLHSLSQLHCLPLSAHTCTVFLSLHTLALSLCLLSFLFIQQRRVLAATHVQPNKCQPTTTRRKSWWLEKG